MLMRGRDAVVVIRTMGKALRKAERTLVNLRRNSEQAWKERVAIEAELAAEKRRNVDLVGECSRLREKLGLLVDDPSTLAASPNEWAQTNDELLVGHAKRYPVAICKGDTARVIGANVLAAMRAAGMQ